MSDKNTICLLEDTLDYTCPPPPYVSRDEFGVDGSEKLQQASPDTRGSTSIWRRALRRVIPNISRQPKPEPKFQSKHPQRWRGHDHMTDTSTKLPLPILITGTRHRYSVDVLCWPRPRPFVAESALWQQARLYLTTDDLSRLREPIPWRANLEDHCHRDSISAVNYPYPVPFSLDEPSGKIKAYHNVPCTKSVGGLTYERTIGLAPQLKQRGWFHQSSDWCFTLSLTSQDGIWLSNLSRADAAALVGLDSAVRKKVRQPWLEVIELDKPGELPCSPLGAAHDIQMRQLVDDTIHRFIQGGD
ncbi:hypothetical protein QBC44DRAFT_357521 [Cladorrhinum sp. PSN332]|nr:hypothetical protein QBC44DRAFT_357521 [Cladorrhinum sp. PSN332]